MKNRIQSSGLPSEIKEKIFEFVSFTKEANGIKEHREYFYPTRLQVLANTMGSSILDPQMKDVINAIASLRGPRPTEARITVRHQFRISRKY